MSVAGVGMKVRTMTGQHRLVPRHDFRGRSIYRRAKQVAVLLTWKGRESSRIQLPSDTVGGARGGEWSAADRVADEQTAGRHPRQPGWHEGGARRIQQHGGARHQGEARVRAPLMIASREIAHDNRTIADTVTIQLRYSYDTVRYS